MLNKIVTASKTGVKLRDEEKTLPMIACPGVPSLLSTITHWCMHANFSILLRVSQGNSVYSFENLRQNLTGLFFRLLIS